VPAPTFATGDVPSASQVNDWFVNTLFVRKTGTQSVSGSTVLVNDTQLTLNVAASAIYELSSLLLYDGDAAGDLQLGWSVPAGTTLDYAAMGLGVTATLFTDDQTAYFNLSTVNPSVGALGAGTTCAVRLSGLLVVGGTAGAVTFRWAQRTASATATRVFANSYLYFRRLS
jgi:hypothetical protein